MRVALMGGLDAPTGGQAQNNPWPILLRVQDNAFLPNRYRARVRECFMLGSGYGDISSERAYLRLESLSCVLNNGEVVDATIKGYVVGEDGKAGLRGRLVSKQGQVLANALMTGIIAGIGQGFQQSATSYSTSALGSVGTIESGKQIQAGIGTGVGKALDRLSQYYITLAEKMFPIIEVDAGRVVDVVLTKGVTLGMAASGDEDTYTELWKRGRQIMKKSLNPSE
jgi:conjugal transfer pilus assembly protein TraB